MNETVTFLREEEKEEAMYSRRAVYPITTA
jgi:hypothetical protein